VDQRLSAEMREYCGDIASMNLAQTAAGAPTLQRPYVTRSLSLDRVSQAFPLIHAAELELSLGQWVKYAKDHLQGKTPDRDGERGIATIESDDGYIHGLFLYTVDCDLKRGRSLRCEHIVALDLFDGEKVAASILDAIHDLARKHRCGAVSVSVQFKNGSFHELLEHAGHSKELIVFRKPVEGRGRLKSIGRD